jgi:hypothetical protein
MCAGLDRRLHVVIVDRLRFSTSGVMLDDGDPAQCWDTNQDACDDR